MKKVLQQASNPPRFTSPDVGGTHCGQQNLEAFGCLHYFNQCTSASLNISQSCMGYKEEQYSKVVYIT